MRGCGSCRSFGRQAHRDGPDTGHEMAACLLRSVGSSLMPGAESTSLIAPALMDMSSDRSRRSAARIERVRSITRTYGRFDARELVAELATECAHGHAGPPPPRSARAAPSPRPHPPRCACRPPTRSRRPQRAARGDRHARSPATSAASTCRRSDRDIQPRTCRWWHGIRAAIDVGTGRRRTHPQSHRLISRQAGIVAAGWCVTVSPNGPARPLGRIADPDRCRLVRDSAPRRPGRCREQHSLTRACQPCWSGSASPRSSTKPAARYDRKRGRLRCNEVERD